jgi:hypothetical protein
MYTQNDGKLSSPIEDCVVGSDLLPPQRVLSHRQLKVHQNTDFCPHEYSEYVVVD